MNQNIPEEAYIDFQVLKKPRSESEGHVKRRRSRNRPNRSEPCRPPAKPRARCRGHMGNILGLTHMCRPSPFLRQSPGASSRQSSCFLESLIVFAFSKSLKTSFIGQGRDLPLFYYAMQRGAGVGESSKINMEVTLSLQPGTDNNLRLEPERLSRNHRIGGGKFFYLASQGAKALRMRNEAINFVR